jgi:galactokinase
MDPGIHSRLTAQFERHFGQSPAVAAYAPGRIEVLGNHTDYNEGFVLSAAINFGTFFVAAPAPDETCRLVAGDLMEEVRFPAGAPRPSPDSTWANCVKGVFAKLAERGGITSGFNGMFLGNVPLGAGLSSSAALEITAGLALAELYGIEIPALELAKIGQAAEHEFVGVRCGLLDQITSLHGRGNALVLTDFRSLAVEHVPLGDDACFLICNTRARHSLVNSEYNERRARCEEATRFFASVLPHPVRALRDVSLKEWETWFGRMDAVTARRAAHVIGEDERVLQGRTYLSEGRLREFGRLMYDSHESSQNNFENSCRELDVLVEAARANPKVIGARLSGGGFGGSAVALVHPGDAGSVSDDLGRRYDQTFGHPCEILVIRPSAGAAILKKRG